MISSDFGVIKDISAKTTTGITVVALDGTVYADTGRPASMENHANREELRTAISNGEGHSLRHNNTLNIGMLYYAVRIKRQEQC